MAEYYRRYLLLKNNRLRHLIKQILSLTSDELVVMFGSQIRGYSTNESDIDLYVETDKADLRDRLKQLSDSLNIKIGNFDKESPLGKEVIKNHVILRGVERFYKLIK
jgi:predicted nucleotidyltransferase